MPEITDQHRRAPKRPCGKIEPRQTWWLNTDLFAGFLEHLLSDGFTNEELIRVVRKPWSWTPEFNEWLRKAVSA